MTYYFDCPNCGTELEAYVVDSKQVEFPEQCEECGIEITEAFIDKHYLEALADAHATRCDAIYERMKDKEMGL